jgi:3-deoxy-manno-octulosonate cytidylyltransferase (CMP-KDO synthetase)
LSFTILIPARLASTRLPNKPLADIGGAPMIVRVAQRALLCGALVATPVRVVVAGDSSEIIAACQAHGIDAVLTRADHLSGSDRLAEACDILGLADNAIVVNVQGDEPLMDPKLILAVADLLQARPEASMSTAAHVIETLTDFNNPNIVKVVLDARGLALYFSRAAIPMARDFARQAWWHGADGENAPSAAVAASNAATPGPAAPAPASAPSPLMRGAAPLRHIGIYGYRVGFLRLFPTLAQAPIEVAEALEQLRAMWHGHRIAVHVTPHAPGPGVDTPEDLARVRGLFKT